MNIIKEHNSFSEQETLWFKKEDERFLLVHDDAINALNRLPAHCVDVIFADPPYNLSNDGFSCHAGKRVSVNKGEWDKSKGIDEDYKFHKKWIDACQRILKPHGSLWITGTYHSIYECGYALKTLDWHILNEIIWYKPNAAPNLACRMFAASHETLIWAKVHKKHKHIFNYKRMKYGQWGKDFLKNTDKQMRSVWAINTPAKSEKKFGKHPTQKPEKLLERIILASSDEGHVILDPFCGSATTGVAALRHGRKFIGIDSEKEYLQQFAEPRLNDIIQTQQSSLL